jgi:hypothetical protein
MSKKNQYWPIKSGFDKKEWEAYIPLDSYSLKKVNELPHFIQQNKLSEAFNSALVVASAGTEYNVYAVIGYRPDEHNTKMDEHAYIYCINKNSGEILGGQFDHVSYLGRTSDIPDNLQQALNLSGITADISFTRMPDPIIGDLEILKKQNILSAVTANFNIAIPKIINNDFFKKIKK